MVLPASTIIFLCVEGFPLRVEFYLSGKKGAIHLNISII